MDAKVKTTQIKDLKSESGTYVLVLKNDTRNAVKVGKWGQLELEPAIYIYIGSAFGPGGIRARIRRHVRTDKRHHWHIDYVRVFMKPVSVWACYATERQEHRWAGILNRSPAFKAIAGFGCSDCSCDAHFFMADIFPEFRKILKITGGTIHLYNLY